MMIVIIQNFTLGSCNHDFSCWNEMCITNFLEIPGIVTPHTMDHSMVCHRIIWEGRHPTHIASFISVSHAIEHHRWVDRRLYSREQGTIPGIEHQITSQKILMSPDV